MRVSTRTSRTALFVWVLALFLASATACSKGSNPAGPSNPSQPSPPGTGIQWSMVTFTYVRPAEVKENCREDVFLENPVDFPVRIGEGTWPQGHHLRDPADTGSLKMVLQNSTWSARGQVPVGKPEGSWPVDWPRKYGVQLLDPCYPLGVGQPAAGIAIDGVPLTDLRWIPRLQSQVALFELRPEGQVMP